MCLQTLGWLISLGVIIAYWMHTKTSETVHQPDSEESWYDVFLGGTCASSTWRQDITIPLLKYIDVLIVLLEYLVAEVKDKMKLGFFLYREHQMSYFNPHITSWSEALIPYEARAKQKCHVLLYVITGHSTSVGSLVEVNRILHMCLYL